jgi:hypothetical protein
MLVNFSKKVWLLVIAFVVVSVGVIAAFSYYPQGALQLPEATPTPQPSVSKTSSPAKPSAEDYTKLVKQYEGFRIQFNELCQSIPNYVTYKNGTKILLDNRSGDARNIKVGATSYYLSGYGYRVVTLSSTVLPKTILLSCGSAVNVGQIYLQK